MKKVFYSRLEAINWIAAHAEDEGQFEVWREQLSFNHIYTGRYFIELDDSPFEVVLLKDDKKQ